MLERPLIGSAEHLGRIILRFLRSSIPGFGSCPALLTPSGRCWGTKLHIILLFHQALPGVVSFEGGHLLSAYPSHSLFTVSRWVAVSYLRVSQRIDKELLVM